MQGREHSARDGTVLWQNLGFMNSLRQHSEVEPKGMRTVVIGRGQGKNIFYSMLHKNAFQDIMRQCFFLPPSGRLSLAYRSLDSRPLGLTPSHSLLHTRYTGQAVGPTNTMFRVPGLRAGVPSAWMSSPLLSLTPSDGHKITHYSRHNSSVFSSVKLPSLGRVKYFSLCTLLQ